MVVFKAVVTTLLILKIIASMCVGYAEKQSSTRRAIYALMIVDIFAVLAIWR